MSQPALSWISVEEYLALEERAEHRSEFFHGEIFAMAGGTPEHNPIAANLVRLLGGLLNEGPCRVYGSDQRVAILDTGLYTYPDVTVVCDEPRFDGPRRTALVNPTLLIEVLSDSTEAYDRGDKFAHYRRLLSLREYLLVSSDRRRVERYTRVEGGETWVLAEYSDPEGSVPLSFPACLLSIRDTYRKVDLPPSALGGQLRPR